MALAGLGYALAGPLPALLGAAQALNAAGVIGTLGGLAVAAAALWRRQAARSSAGGRGAGGGGARASG